MNLVECVIDPLLAVSVTRYCPTGVPGFGGGVELPLLPPPQLTEAATLNRIIARTIFVRPCLLVKPPKNMAKTPRHPLAIHNGRLRGAFNPAVAAIVLMVTVMVPFPATVGGLKMQVLSVGKPEQLGVTVPENPFCAVTVSVVIPEEPGTWTVTGSTDNAITKSASTVPLALPDEPV